nr:hypothetical protein CFP56_71405 [Quercus suber]
MLLFADGMHYLPLAVNSVGTESLGNNLAPSPLHVIQSPLPAHESHGGCYLPRSNSSGGAETLRNSLAQSPSHVIQSPLLDSLPTRRQRRPYHGWISNDEEVDLVQLTPAPLPERE